MGISYIVVYIGAIAILFLFVIMMIDVEVIEKRSNNYLPLLFFLLGGFLVTLNYILYNLGIVKLKNIIHEEEIYIYSKYEVDRLFNLRKIDSFFHYKKDNILVDFDYIEKSHLMNYLSNIKFL
jgi:NADH-ubiquinone oxidoreductase chain 6